MAVTTQAARLTDDQVLELQPRRINRYVPHVPHPPQQAMLALDWHFEELLYGGAAGGGKSDALLMAALKYVDVPGYAAMIFRRTYADLSKADALIPRSQEWLRGTDARWNDTSKTWRFPNGATLGFGYLQHAGDEFNYQGAAFQFLGFDEVTHIPWRQYDYLQSRVRRPAGMSRTLPLRTRCTANPDGRYVDWVREYFVENGLANGRPFLPAKLDDNPSLDRRAYMRTLMRLDPVTRARLLDGDWEVRPPGRFFDRAWFPVVQQAPKVGFRAVRWWDMAATEESEKNPDPDWTVGLRLVERLGRIYVEDVVRFRRTPGETEKVVVQTAEADGRDTWIFMEEEGGSSGKAVSERYHRLLRGFVFEAIPSSGSKIARAKPVSAAAERRELSVIPGPWNRDFFREIEAFPSNAAHDDQVDALSGAYSVIDQVPVADTRPAVEDDLARRRSAGDVDYAAATTGMSF